MFEHTSPHLIRPSIDDHPVGGVSAQRHEIARYAYLQAKRRHLEDDRARGRRSDALELLHDLGVLVHAAYFAIARRLHLVDRTARPISE